MVPATTWNVPAADTVNVKLCITAGSLPLLAVKVGWKVLGEDAAPANVAWPAPPVKVIPDGRAPDSVMVGLGYPEATTLNELFGPSAMVAWFADVNAGATVIRKELEKPVSVGSVKSLLASTPTHSTHGFDGPKQLMFEPVLVVSFDSWYEVLKSPEGSVNTGSGDAVEPSQVESSVGS
jgi:hypothetical protein